MSLIPAGVAGAVPAAAEIRYVNIWVLAERLYRVGAELGMDGDVWAVVCAALLPEAYSSAPAAEPTPHLPGSPEKIKVMRARVQRNQRPFHPKDEPGRFAGDNSPAPRKRSRLDGSGLPRGVSPHRNKFRAVLADRYLGLYDTPEQAAAAVEAARLRRTAEGAADAADPHA